MKKSSKKGLENATRKVKTQPVKDHEKCQQAVQDQSMTMENSWVMMKDQTHKEHEE